MLGRHELWHRSSRKCLKHSKILCAKNRIEKHNVYALRAQTDSVLSVQDLDSPKIQHGEFATSFDRFENR